ncbi:hypothetical protein KY290_027371 [Solanum tuberosum]|uniref:Uncharacterized protein n=1 Tax=Solanum tuberosum TaxID=4113 RepID=A0ABQ7UEY7_SOLTU|nr:hypothetical protein KY290_027371 [Solanum tuberosum]
MACGDSLILLHFCPRDGINNSTNFKFRGFGESTSSDDGDRFRPFSFDFEQPSFTEENIKELIWRESVKFNPDPTY